MKNIKKNTRKILGLIGLLTLVFVALPTQAQVDSNKANFDYNIIISDEEAQDFDAMTLAQIQEFLRSKNSYLQSYFFTGYNPGPGELITMDENLRLDYTRARSAAEIIYNASIEAKINPKFIITTLQKEQGVIERADFDQRSLDYATGYYCFDGQACNPQWQGFGKQVRAAALQFRDYIDNIHTRPFQPGVPSNIDGKIVTPANRITAAMYVYTPHLHGNLLFATIWERYGFGVAGQVVKGLLPHGAVVQAKTGDDIKSIYLISNGQKMLFVNNNALVSRYNPKDVQKISPEEIAKFPDGPEIKYPNYSILENPIGQRYLIDGLVKRLITNKEVFRQLGFSADEIVIVKQNDLDAIPDGQALTADTKYPLGKLLRSTKTNGVYYVKDNIKSPIIDPLIITLNFPTLKIVSIAQATLDTYDNDLPVMLKDGTLVKTKTEANVYVIANGQRRWISDAETFNNLGYSWANIKTISERVLNLHDAGENLKI
jgi:hypothetical protein